MKEEARGQANAQTLKQKMAVHITFRAIFNKTSLLAPSAHEKF